MDNSNQAKDKELQEYIKELVIARINALSKDLEISVGGENVTRVNNYILVTRPNYDFPTTYLYQWSELVIDEAKSKGITVLDLDGKKANKRNFASYISRNNPRLIFLNGHGSRDCVTGYDNEILLDAGNCEVLLREKIIYARSCDEKKL